MKRYVVVGYSSADVLTLPSQHLLFFFVGAFFCTCKPVVDSAISLSVVIAARVLVVWFLRLFFSLFASLFFLLRGFLFFLSARPLRRRRAPLPHGSGARCQSRRV